MNDIIYQRRPRNKQAEIQRNLRTLLGDKDPSSIRKLRKRVEAKGYTGNDITSAMFFERTKPFPDHVYDRNEPLSTPKPRETMINRLQAMQSVTDSVLRDLTPDNYPFVSWLLRRQPKILRCAVLLVINHKLLEQIKNQGISRTPLQIKFLQEFGQEFLQQARKATQQQNNNNG
jgi:hypothetical protein